MVECIVGALRRTDRDHGKVQLSDGVGGDGGGYGGLRVGVADKEAGGEESKANNDTPEALAQLGLAKEEVRGAWR